MPERFGTQAAERIIEAQAQADLDPTRFVQRHDDIAQALRHEATSEHDRAIADRYAASTEPTTHGLEAPGTVHPDPGLAARGWVAAAPGIWERQPEPDPQPEPELEI
jgi:hypothetical protein